jgi:hypothetical protein
MNVVFPDPHPPLMPIRLLILLVLTVFQNSSFHLFLRATMAIKTKMTDMLPSRERFKTEVVLLSHGYSNRQAFPGGKITVYPWDNSVDEWMLRSDMDINSQNFMWKVAACLCNLNGCPIEQFVYGDLSTVLLVSRSIRQNYMVEYEPVCPHCKVKNKMEKVRVPEALKRIGEKPDDYLGFDTCTLPVCEDVIRIRPLLVKDEMVILSRTDTQRKEVSDRLARVLAGIVDVNQGAPDNLSEILTWHSALHPRDQVFLTQVADEFTPHLDPTLSHSCDSCKMGFRYPLPLDDPEFFRARG